MNPYFKQPVIDWLLEKNDPIIRNLTISDILHEDYSVSYEEAASYFEKTFSGKSFKSLNSSILYFNFAAECAIRAEESFIQPLVKRIIEKSFVEGKGFSPEWKPLTPCAGWTGSILRSLIKSGYTGDEIHSCAEWLLSIQRHDGGWFYSPVAGFKDSIKLYFSGKTGKGLLREDDKEFSSSIIATACVLGALAPYKNIYNKYHLEIKKGIKFLKNAVFTLRNEHNGIYCNDDFSKIIYPVLSQTDLLSILKLLTEENQLNDGIIPYFNKIVSKQNSAGKFQLEADSHGTIHSLLGIKKGKPDKWCTLNAYRLFSM
ncbi:MAG: hypothetical protein KAZ87_06580 [Spirochaetes bacterium]|nr:hypothetical protein [Spirochaetota bacterium]